MTISGFRIGIGLALAAAALAAPLQGAERVYPALEEPEHKVVFHNGEIDVYEVRLEPGVQSFYHRHSRDQLGIVMRSSTSWNQTLGAAEVATKVDRGAISYIPHSTLGGYAHRVRASHGEPFWVIGIEFAKPAGAGATRLTASPDQQRFDFPQGRVERVAIAPGSRQEIAGDLIVPMSAGVLKVPAAGGGWTFREGEPKWIGDSPARTYLNESKSPASLVVLTLGE